MALATLIKDGQRVEAKDKAEADKLFAQGFTLETSPPPGAPPSGAPAQTNPYLEAILSSYENPEYQASQAQTSQDLDALTGLTSQVPGYQDRQSQQFETDDPILQMLLKQQGEQTGDIASVAAEARNRHKNIFDPRKREALVAKAVANATSRLAGTQGLIGQQRGFAGQQAQTALDTLLSQIGVAETKYGASKEKEDMLRELLQGAAESQYIPKSEDEWADMKRALELDAQYDTSGTTPIPPNLNFTEFYDKDGNFVGNRIRHPKTGQFVYVDGEDNELIMKNGNLYRPGYEGENQSVAEVLVGEGVTPRYDKTLDWETGIVND